ncbi:hypothetical protein [Terricaulis sp.]|uniref:hypothetical protein n=1 Tax=Terricaulis sp. TaxID=2768686 RepID=UPI003784F6AF
MFRPGSVLWLLGHELRITTRNWSAAARRNNPKSGVVRALIFYAILGALLLFGGFWLAKVIAPIPPSLDPTLLGFVGAIFALLFTFMLSQSLMLITESLYQRGDLDLLLASPLPPWRILIVRMAAVAINVALFYLILSTAVFVWLPLFGGWRWMAFMPAVLLLALFATAAGLLLAQVMFRLIGPKNTRVTAQIVAALIGAGFFLAMQAQNFVPYEERAQLYQQMMERLIPVFGDPTGALSIPARAAFGQPLAVAVWAAVALGFYLFAVWWYGVRFVANAASIAGAGGKRKRDTSERTMRGGLLPSLVRKEWRLLARDPLLLSQILVQLLYLLPLFAVFATRLGEEGVQRYSIGGFASAFVLLATSLSASLAWLTVSAEDAPDLIAAAPAPKLEIDNAKAIAAGAPVALLLFLPALGASLFISPLAGVWLFIGGLCAIASACLIAVWHQVPGSRKNFRRRTRGGFLVGFGQIFVTLGWVAATAAAVSGWEIVAILPTLIALGALLALHESRPKPV